MMKRMKRIAIMALFSTTVGLNAFCAEKMVMKSGDLYSCSLVLQDAKKVVALIFGYRVEVPVEEVKQISFESSEDEFEIVLNDGTVLRGQIVEQDSDFYTIGSSAGLNTIEKGKVMEIRNPKLAEYYTLKKVDSISFHAGIMPSYSTVLSGFGSYYNTFWGGGIYAELGLLRNFWISMDSDFFMLTPQFASTNEILFLIPIQLGFKYESAFAEQGSKNPLSHLFWFVKAGVGISTDIFLEKAEGRTSTALAMSMAVSYGMKYAIADFLSVGLGGKTTVVFEPSTYILIQSAGAIVEFKL